MDYYAGLDVSLRSCALCIVDEKGSVRLERELPCEIEAIADALADFPNPVARVGFEAGTMSQHLYFGLRDRGFDVVCMERGRSMRPSRPCATRRIATTREASLRSCGPAGSARSI